MFDKKYTLIFLLLAGVLMLSLVGCETEEPIVDEPGYFRITDRGVFLGGELLADKDEYEAAIAEGQVIFYTAHSLAHDTEMANLFMRRFPEITVEVTRAGGATLHERMMTEHAAGQLKADVVLNSDTNYLRELYNRDLLMEYVPYSCDLFPEASKNTGYWYPTGASIIVIAYHTDLVDEADAPKDWIDLGDPKWEGILGGQRLGGGAMWSMVAFVRSQLGKEVLDSWAPNKPIMYTSGAGLATALIAGEFHVTPMGLFAAYGPKYQMGAPIELVFPESGFPLYIPVIGLLETGENPNAAQLFYNWYLSAEAQTRLSTLRGQYSLRDDVPPAPFLPPLTGMNYWIPDPDVYLDDAIRDQWVAEATSVWGWD